MQYKVKLTKKTIVTGILNLDSKQELEMLIKQNNQASCIKDAPLNVLILKGILAENKTFYNLETCEKATE
jgi:hypothetical protein